MLSSLVKKQRESDKGSPKKKSVIMLDSDNDDEEDEDAPIHDTKSVLQSGSVPEDLMHFYERVIADAAAKELKIPDEDFQFEDAHLTQFGLAVKPFGSLRTSVVEFLAEVYSLHHS